VLIFLRAREESAIMVSDGNQKGNKPTDDKTNVPVNKNCPSKNRKKRAATMAAE
jgi:hypothetical protein